METGITEWGEVEKASKAARGPAKYTLPVGVSNAGMSRCVRSTAMCRSWPVYHDSLRMRRKRKRGEDDQGTGVDGNWPSQQPTDGLLCVNRLLLLCQLFRHEVRREEAAHDADVGLKDRDISVLVKVQLLLQQVNPAAELAVVAHDV